MKLKNEQNGNSVNTDIKESEKEARIHEQSELCMRRLHAFGTTLICDREKGHVPPSQRQGY